MFSREATVAAEKSFFVATEYALKISYTNLNISDNLMVCKLYSYECVCVWGGGGGVCVWETAAVFMEQ